MTAYYNEIDPAAAQWLRNLIDAGHIAPGIVDERSIEDVYPSDLRGFTQCHFFAGIGVWSYALRQAGWSDERPVWTGSCPCQPFSSAGKGAGFADERHLWPAFHHLVKECSPATVIGEQVASKDVDPWIDLVQTDLEALGYAVGAIAFPAAGVGAPHIRDRTYWVADTAISGWGQSRLHAAGNQAAIRKGAVPRASYAGADGRLANTQQHDSGRQATPAHHGQPQTDGPTDWACRCGGAPGGLADNNGDGRQPGSAGCPAMGHGQAAGADCGAGGMADTADIGAGKERLQRVGEQRLHAQCRCGLRDAGNREWSTQTTGLAARPGPINGLWRDADRLLCRDGKWRPVEPGTFPLVTGAPARVVRLRAYGNAINAKAAQAFIECLI